jgi:hypothetical protein
MKGGFLPDGTASGTAPGVGVLTADLHDREGLKLHPALMRDLWSSSAGVVASARAPVLAGGQIAEVGEALGPG